MIFLSVAHSKLDPGNVHNGMIEHELSIAMTNSCASALKANDIECRTMLSVKPSPEHLHEKIQLLNSLQGCELAVEIHTNGVDAEEPDYSEVIYYPGSLKGRLAAGKISDVIEQALGSVNHDWPSNGSVPDSRGLYFLRKASCPAVIVEPLFQSNNAQAEWLKSDGATNVIGMLVAEGIVNYLNGVNQ